MSQYFESKYSAGSPAVRVGFQRSALYRHLAVVPLLLAGSIGSVALADNATAGRGGQRAFLEEVVVTASRRQESLQDIAASVSVLGAAELADLGITSFEDVKNAVAGLHLEAHGNMSTAQVRIRGVGDSPNSGIDPSVGVLVDGVYQLRGGAAFTELMDIERIEVLRGPQGTLFGKNTTAGVIHIHTKNPDTHELAGKVQGVVGNYSAGELRGTVNIPLIEDKLALRASGFTTRRDGYSRNVFLHQDTQNDNKEGGRIKLLWHATDNFDVLWSSEMLTQKGRLDQGLVKYGHDNLTSGAYRGQPWENLAAALGKTLPPISMGRTANNTREFKDEVERHVLTLDWSLPSHHLQSITAYEELDTWIVSDRDRTMLDLSHSINEPKTKVRSQELLLSSEQDGPLSYVVGAFFQEEKLHSPTQLITGPDQIALGGSPGTIISTTDRKHTTRAGFASLTYELNEQWSLVGGVRYTADKKNELASLDMGARGVIYPQDEQATFKEWTYTTKLRYQFADNKMAYLSVDRGFKSGGFNRQDTSCLLGSASRCLADDRLFYKPEITDSIEVGLKSEWLDNRVRFNGALFYQTYDDYQVKEAIPGEVAILISNAAKVESKGIELDLNAALTDHLTLNTALAWVMTEYDKFDYAPCAVPTSPGCSGGRHSLTGKQLDNAAKVMTNAGLEYRAMIGGQSALEWFARVDAVYRSGTNLDVTQSPETEQGGYALYSARLGLETADEQWKLTLWGRNLGDKRYAIVSSEDAGGVTRLQGMPRTYGLTVDYQF